MANGSASSRCAAFVSHQSPEGEGKSLGAGVKKLDLEAAVVDWLRLPDQLVEPLFTHRAVALLVNVPAMRSAWLLSVEAHLETRGRASCGWPHDEMQVARMELV